jgi:guanylate kinase
MKPTLDSHTGHALIFAGPHGAGKDTLAGHFRHSQPSVERIVRHITRPAAPGEVDGHDYHFVTADTFRAMIGQTAFIEHSTYPDCIAGTSHSEVINKLERADFASLTANFEEGVMLQQKLGEVGLSSVCFFISPVPREIMIHEPGAYIAALRARMAKRGRPNDRIENKLQKAILYRDMYIADERTTVYIDNSNGRLAQATRDIMQVAEQARASVYPIESL